jgi:hypothetical protein
LVLQVIGRTSGLLDFSMQTTFGRTEW